ncbi:MAG TPA: hypothetical protein VM513_34000 [Kofleriaceae bacterium]|jgi:hypothetical protein|nr:hypothetical protein [Kofleriaceae bacterium]
MQSLAGMKADRRHLKADRRHLVSNLGHETSSFARRVGGGTAALARRVGDNTVVIARRVGPRRAVIGVVAISAAIAGSIVLMRYLKRRREERQIVDYDALEEPSTSAGVRVRERSRMQERQPMRPSGY